MPAFSKIIPFILIVFTLAFSVRLSDVVTGVQGLSSTAVAKEPEKEAEKKMANKTEKKQENGNKEKMMDKEKSESEHKNMEAPKWKDASDSDIDISGVKADMFKDLVVRRQKLDQREKDLIAKEALLKATDREMSRKIQELSKLKKEIESLLNKQTEEEEARISSLVKIYEGMKPKDAARIFDTLDLDVLVSVMSKMSERKVAPVLAAMSPERARTVTIMLAEQQKLPEL